MKDKVAIITGSGRGIGRAIAHTFSDEGAKVALIDIDAEQNEKVKKEIEEKGGTAACYTVNVSDAKEVEAVVKDVQRSFGSLDIVINNAGITRDAMLHKMTDEQFQEVLDVHMKGTFLFMREASHYMKEQNEGTIVNISSIAGKTGNIGQVNYSGAKAGIVGMTKAAAKELARYNIRVNAIQPGFIETDMTRAIPEKTKEMMIAGIPLKRIGKPQDIANAALFLASDKSDYITGIVIEIAGGVAM